MAGDETIKILIKLDSGEAQKEMSKFGQIAQKGLSALASVAKVGAEAVSAVSTNLTAAGEYAVKIGADFEAGMSQVEAVSGATADEMDRIAKKAKEMGVKTKFSASESAEAFNYMAMAGWEAEDMMEGIEGIMNLAAASGEDLANTSDIVADALTAFGLTAADSGHFADILAAASSSANTNVGMMGETFKYVASLAGSLGYSAEDTAAAIGLMASAGIKGSQAGASLHSVITRMAKPTEESANAMYKLGVSMEDEEGTMYSFMDIMKQIRTGFEGGRITQEEYTESVRKWKNMLAEGSVNEKEYANAIEALDIALNGATESQKEEIAAELAGQEAMSGLLAIVNASEEDFEKLAQSIDSAEGAAQRMAEIQLDNLQGQVALLKSAVDGLGIEIFLGMEEPLKEAAKKGIEYVNQLTEAFKEDGLEGAVREVGNIFGELAAEAAEHAPEMIEVSVGYIQAFAGGIYDNREKIGEAAKDIVFVLADGLVQLLPKSIGEPIRTAIEEIRKSFDSGGLKEVTKDFMCTMSNVGEMIGNLVSAVFPAFVKTIDFVGEHLDILAASATACVVAYSGMKAVDKVASAVESASAAFEAASAVSIAYAEAMKVEETAVNAIDVAQTLLASTMSKSELAIGVMSGRVEMATAAKVAWHAATSALTSPLGLVITAVAALAAGIAVYKLTTEEVVTAEEMQAQRLQDISNKVSEQKSKWEELEQTKQKQLDADLSLMDHTQELWEELQKLTDANGKVKEGYEDRVNFITGRLNEALGTEIEQTDGVIQKYDELKESMDALLMKKRAQIILDASLEEYNTALQNQREAEMAQAELKRGLDEQDIAALEAENTYLEAQEELMDRIIGGDVGAARRLSQLRKNWDQEKALLAEKQLAYDESAQLVGNYYATISDYEALYAASQSGNAEQIKEFIESVTYSYQTATTASASELAAQLLLQQQHIALLREGMASSQKGITQDMIDNAEERLAKMQEEYNKEVSNLDAYTGEIAGLMDKLTGDMTQDEAELLAVWLGMVANAEAGGEKISLETEKMANTVIGNLDKMPEQTKEIMKNALDPMMEELERRTPDFFQRAFELGNGFCNKLMKAFWEHSPSKRTRKIFNYAMEGMKLGISDEEDNLYAQSDGVAENVMDSLAGLDISAIMRKVEDAVFGMSSVMPMAVVDKITMSRVASETGTGYDPYCGIDYGRMGMAFREALGGVEVSIDGYTAGEILSPYVDRNFGMAEKRKERW